MKAISTLLINKDENTLNSIKNHVGERKFKKMEGISIYRTAKRIWKRYHKKDNWGKTNN